MLSRQWITHDLFSQNQNEAHAVCKRRTEALNAKQEF